MVKNEDILNYINSGYSLNEIAKNLNMTTKQVYYQINLLRNAGYQIRSNYHADGNITYYLANNLINNFTPLTITLKESDVIFKFVAIADVHLGHLKARLDYLDKIYNECRKEGINTIFIVGDFLEGRINPAFTIHQNIMQQIDQSIKTYPYDKDILNYLLLGNHDVLPLVKDGLSLENTLLYRRHDIIPFGYGESVVKIKKDLIAFKHDLMNFKINKIPKYSPKFTLEGHHHLSRFVPQTNTLNLPPCSDILVNPNQAPGFVIGQITFKNNCFQNVNLLSMAFIDKKIYHNGEINLDFTIDSPKKRLRKK